MIKYIPNDSKVVFSEIPDEITLAINISNCQFKCYGCHSPYLREDIGDELTNDVIDELIKKHNGVTCVCFMGVGNDQISILNLGKYIKTKYPNLKLGVFYGSFFGLHDDFSEIFDYIKLGEYNEKLGPINCETTNQRLFYHNMDITFKFWNKVTII